MKTHTEISHVSRVGATKKLDEIRIVILLPGEERFGFWVDLRHMHLFTVHGKLKQVLGAQNWMVL
jgi:hypothetical protein